MKNWTRLSLFIGLVLVSFVIYTGCASSGSQVYESSSEDDMADIDALLGLDSSDDESIGEDDVLKLLGVADEDPVSDASSSTDDSDDILTWSTTEESDSGTTFSEPGMGTETSNDAFAYNEPDPAPAYTEVTTPPVTTPATTTTSSSFKMQYDAARRLYNARNYRSAVQEFELLLSQDMNHALSDNCQYWIGESYYGLGQYQRAIAAFEKVFTFPKSNKYADSQLKLGLSYMRLNNTQRAQTELQKLIDNYPTSEYVSVAKQYLSRIAAGG